MTAKLTPRELEIFFPLAQKKSNRQIADALNISIRTVEKHVENIFKKLQIKSRKEVEAFFHAVATD